MQCQKFSCGLSEECAYVICYDDCIEKSCWYYGLCEACIYNGECYKIDEIES